jgi:hypothetical protein
VFVLLATVLGDEAAEGCASADNAFTGDEILNGLLPIV